MSKKSKKLWPRFTKLRTLIVLFILFVTCCCASSLLAQAHRSQEFPNLTPSREVKRGAKYGAIAFIALAVIYALARLASTSERRLSPAQARPHDAQLSFDPLTQPAPIFSDEGQSSEKGEDDEEERASSATKASSPLADFIPDRYKEKGALKTLSDEATYVRFRADDVELRLLKSELSRDLAAKGRFIKAGKKLATLEHENLFQVTAVENETWPFWQVKKLAGKTIEEGTPSEGGYSCCHVLEMARPLLNLLDYLRQKEQKIGAFSQSTILLDEDNKPIVAHMEPHLAEGDGEAGGTEASEGDARGTEASEGEAGGDAAPAQDEELKKAQRADLLSLAHMLEVLTEEHGRPPKFDELLMSLREDGGNLELSLAELSAKLADMTADFPCKEGWQCTAGDSADAEGNEGDSADAEANEGDSADAETNEAVSADVAENGDDGKGNEEKEEEEEAEEEEGSS